MIGFLGVNVLRKLKPFSSVMNLTTLHAFKNGLESLYFGEVSMPMRDAD